MTVFTEIEKYISKFIDSLNITPSYRSFKQKKKSRDIILPDVRLCIIELCLQISIIMADKLKCYMQTYFFV